MDIGVDIVEIERIQRAVKKYGRRFLERIFTPKEIEYCKSKSDPSPHLAARYAAKEAVFKALGLKKKRGLVWKNIEVISRPSGKPDIRVRGSIARDLKKRKTKKIICSLSHSRKYAVAQVIII